MPGIADALQEDRYGTVITLEVTSGARHNSFPAGYNVWRNSISCRVTEQAIEGKANRAIIALVSEKLAVPAHTVSIQSGVISSQKKILVRGVPKKVLLLRLQDIS